MAAFVETLRDGHWLTRERVRLVALALLAAFALGLVFLVATSDGLNDRLGRPLGTDFSNVYAAGTYVLEGHATAPFDPASQFAREQAIFGAATQFYGWHYPPFFLGVAALLALMPYALALLLWQGVTLLLYLLTVRAILSTSCPALCRASTPSFSVAAKGVDGRDKPGHDGMWLILALAFPAVFINLGHGHNGFLTAALFAGALLQLDRRPVLAGILFGLIAYKPQFGVLIPLVLAASGRWRAFAAAAATVILLALVVTLVFGVDVWRAFLASMTFTREVVLERGDTGWHKIQSVFSWVRMWGGSVSLAYLIQATVTCAIAAALVWLWRSPAAFSLKAAALLIATLLATPYSLDYDLMLLAPAIAWLAVDAMQRGFAPFEKLMLASLWLMPLLARTLAEATFIPLAAPLMLAAFASIFRAALSQSAETAMLGVSRSAK
jgi:hypothetical protein